MRVASLVFAAGALVASVAPAFSEGKHEEKREERHDRRDRHDLAIESAHPDLGAGTLTIVGHNLEGRGLRVTLGELKLDVLSQESSTVVTTLPRGVAPGTYRLEVGRGHGSDREDRMDVTIGAVGPQGPPGEPGPPGPPGSPSQLAGSPSALDFGSIPIGRQSLAKALQIVNVGVVETGPLAVQLEGANAAEFSVGVDDCSGVALGPGTSCRVEVVFSPAELGPRAAGVTVAGDPGGLAGAVLTGTGVDADTGTCAAVVSSHLGCEFYAVSLSNSLMGSFAMADLGLTVVNPGVDAGMVTVTGGNLLGPLEVGVPAEGMIRIGVPLVPALVRPGASTLIADGAYHIVSDVPVAVAQFNPGHPTQPDFAFTADASLLLPVRAAGASYRAASWASWDDYSGFLAVVGTQDGTSVTVEPTDLVRAGGGVAMTGLSTVTLDRGDVLQVLNTAPGFNTGSYGGSLSGSSIVASHPVVVFGGHDCSNVPENAGFCDHMEEQIAPVGSYGVEYVVPTLENPFNPSPPRTVQLIGLHDGTTLIYNPPVPGAPTTINAGQRYLVASSGSFHVVASAPLMVTLQLHGEQSAGGGDPSMGVVPATEHFLLSYDVALGQYQSNRLTIMALSGTSVQVDGVPVPNGSFVPVGSSGYGVAQVDPCAGAPACADSVHHVLGDGPVGVLVHGYDLFTSYLYPGGTALVAP